MIKLNKVKKNIQYIIKDVDQSSIGSRLIQLGFHVDTKVKLKRKAPLFGNPLLFELEESQFALTKEEAMCVSVEEFNE